MAKCSQDRRPTLPTLTPRATLPASAALIGISTDGRAIAVDIDAAPHVLVRTGTDGGTTSLRTRVASRRGPVPIGENYP